MRSLRGAPLGTCRRCHCPCAACGPKRVAAKGISHPAGLTGVRNARRHARKRRIDPPMGPQIVLSNSHDSDGKIWPYVN